MPSVSGAAAALATLDNVAAAEDSLDSAGNFIWLLLARPRCWGPAKGGSHEPGRSGSLPSGLRFAPHAPARGAAAAIAAGAPGGAAATTVLAIVVRTSGALAARRHRGSADRACRCPSCLAAGRSWSGRAAALSRRQAAGPCSTIRRCRTAARCRPASYRRCRLFRRKRCRPRRSPRSRFRRHRGVWRDRRGVVAELAVHKQLHVGQALDGDLPDRASECSAVPR